MVIYEELKEIAKINQKCTELSNILFEKMDLDGLHIESAEFIKNCVAFGPSFPGSEDVCHIADEYLKVSDFMDNVLIYVKAIYELTK